MIGNIKKQFKDKDIQFYIGSFIVLSGISVWMEFCGSYKLQSNTWYYSLSTIIQSLAAILGIVGSFFVFRINQISIEVGEYRKRMINFLSERENTKTSNYHHLSDNDVKSKFVTALEAYQPNMLWSGFFTRYEKQPLDGNAQTQALENWLKLFENNVEKAEGIRKFLGISVKIITATIISCAIILFLTEIVLSWLFLALSLWAFVVSLYYVAKAILNITKS